jgi:hypothetical protein
VTTLANSPVFWIGLLAGLGGLYVLPTVIAVFRRVENIGVGGGVLELSADCLASRACRGLHDAGKG